MAKKFTIKKHRLRARARRRKHSLKVNPENKGIKANVQQQNLDVIASLEAKIKAVASN
ncbi:MAG: hypothetical protein KDE26_28195 [Bacteroidetes bacterium]|nr:hypothetical protein [Bacteroidota bacterium]MCB0847177.1 hypothetical protein [Bacteroidota bacterium]